ncbi:hypothetical protein VTK73DRAFT_2513 [Phialemonium thermophilum]|uniref:Zn(2)-C6 fungal-type domain-containing protein n=1 Tax=Phialemonium thermophilum TaxID=223376 RepID=A0ABR3X4A9_9PEZI
MEQQQQQQNDKASQQTRARNRPVRSREGCLTCKRRKVKCDEQRPRCSHCERLNLECKWRPLGTPSLSYRSPSDPGTKKAPTSTSGSERGAGQMRSPAMADPSPDSSLFQAPNPHAVNQIFDYASFMWDAGDVWQQVSPGIGQPMTLGQVVHDGGQFPRPDDASRDGMLLSSTSATMTIPDHVVVQEETSEPSTVPDTTNLSEQLQNPAENHRLMDYFIHAVIPPILAEVETQKKWFAMRQVLVAMASASRMVRWAILAFSNLMLIRRAGPWLASQQNHYENAMSELAKATDEGHADLSEPGPQRENLLATLFFLSYVDILEGRMDPAHMHLKRAYGIFQRGEKAKFGAVERQFLLWLRLLDARAVSAGGEGLFLSKDDEVMLVDTPPANFEAASAAAMVADLPDPTHEPEGDIEDVLFQVLYQPGIVFFQKVQSFMGRISQIDPWHRSRGTVEDEIEVMNIGASIAADLRTLYEHRPLLMDYAVAGKLTAPHVSAHLAFAITRAFRTYLSNYYASKVHLHRVAYKTLPLTREAADALNQIRRLARLIVEGLDSEEALPVNMLWPLLMLGTEEQDPQERIWIKTQILRMEKVAGNAKITAQVLEEVQARQDAAKTRVDIRSVMHAIFNSCFAIL